MFKALCIHREGTDTLAFDNIEASDKRAAELAVKIEIRKLGRYACQFKILVEDKRHA